MNRLDIKDIEKELSDRIIELSKEKGLSYKATGLYILEEYFKLSDEKEKEYKNRSKAKKGSIYKKSLEKQKKIEAKIDEVVKADPDINLKEISKKVGISYQNMMKRYILYTKEIKEKYQNGIFI